MYTVTFKDGTTLEVAEFDGGGCFLDSDAYEVHGYDREDKAINFNQGDVESVVDEEGNPFHDWGNPYFPGHPYASYEHVLLKELMKKHLGKRS